jgi:hypothetical protein
LAPASGEREWRVDLDPNTIVGLASAGLAVIGAVVSALLVNRTNKQAHELERRRRRETAEEAAQRVLDEYREVLLDVAQTLQARLYNIVELNYFSRYLHCGDPTEERYARDYTVYALAEYLCWVEIVRREAPFLNVDASSDRRRWTGNSLAFIAGAQLTIQSDRYPLPFRVFRGAQRAIAEVMTVPATGRAGARFEPMGFATFCQRLDTDPTFASWFERLRFADIDAIAAGGVAVNQRLVTLTHDMVDLIDLLDPKAERIPAQVRRRLSAPRPGLATEPIVG